MAADPIAKALEDVQRVAAEQAIEARRLMCCTTTGRELVDKLQQVTHQVTMESRSMTNFIEGLQKQVVNGDITTQQFTIKKQAELARRTAVIERLEKQALDLTTVLEAHLRAAVVAPVDPAREAMLHADLRDLLDNAPDPQLLMFEMVQDPDSEMAAVATSSYAEAWMRAHRIPEAKQTAAALRRVAAQAAVRSADPTRRAVAEALAGFSAVAKARDAAGYLARVDVQKAEEAPALPDWALDGSVAPEGVSGAESA